MSEVTRILGAIEEGDPQAAEQLLLLVYDELRKLAVFHLRGSCWAIKIARGFRQRRFRGPLLRFRYIFRSVR
jgi:hypothetical protein